MSLWVTVSTIVYTDGGWDWVGTDVRGLRALDVGVTDVFFSESYGPCVWVRMFWDQSLSLLTLQKEPCRTLQ